MIIYVITKWDGNRWAVKGNAFVNKAKAIDYVKDDDALRYVRVTLDVDCG